MLILKSRQRILAEVARNPEIHVNALMKLVGSLRDIKGILNELEEANLIYSKQVGNIRQLFPVLDNPLSISAFELVEEQEKLSATSKFAVVKELIDRIDSFKKIFGSNLVSIVLFGSIARGHLTRASDIDILFIVKKADSTQKNRIIRLFQTISLNIGREATPLIIEENEFKRQLIKAASFAVQVQKERIILYNAKAFLLLQK
ncbi:MAG: nucleotidyltransferase domain-containing protein [Candidatus Diapherotrites archaeon]